MKLFHSIPEHILTWIPKQHMFFVASAPLTQSGHVNVSPKGYDDTFHIVNENKVWYEDITGSGIETISHVRENGRITIMFIALEGPPNIVRLFGQGTIHEFGTPEYDALIPAEKRKPGSRSAIVVDIYHVTTSCGYGIPFYTYQSDRPKLLDFTSRAEAIDGPNAPPPQTDKEPSAYTRGMKWYWEQTNTKSLDGLPSGFEGFKVDRPLVSVWPKQESAGGGGGGGGDGVWGRMRGRVNASVDGGTGLVVGLAVGAVLAGVYGRMR